MGGVVTAPASQVPRDAGGSDPPSQKLGPALAVKAAGNALQWELPASSSNDSPAQPTPTAPPTNSSPLNPINTRPLSTPTTTRYHHRRLRPKIKTDRSPTDLAQEATASTASQYGYTRCEVQPPGVPGQRGVLGAGPAGPRRCRPQPLSQVCHAAGSPRKPSPFIHSRPSCSPANNPPPSPRPGSAQRPTTARTRRARSRSRTARRRSPSASRRAS